MNKKTVYWDSCVWLRLINDKEEAELCQSTIDCAKRGEVQIWTSSLTLAEVYKFKCEGPKALAAEQDVLFEQYIESEWVVEVQVDHAIATLARRLCREHPPHKKPNDAIHLASAVLNNLDEFHTFDQDDLLVLAGRVLRQDGMLLSICKPQPPDGGNQLLLAPPLGG
ncbi:type II toxin-antitoxin system VapC family toxin [Variovorax sp. RB2P76]|uniref:type II toxin-antitoxin system VapC family toxin n=1 Tax=Variovorax sp. RB2P76 TaxID=3443736 RepID=UPI003F448D52